jgi:integrase
MGSIEDQRWRTDRKTGERRRTAYEGPKPFRVRYRDATGTDKAKNFRLKREAQTYLDSVSVELTKGTYRDPALGRKTLAEFHQQWQGTQLDLRESTRARDESYINTHVLPRWGSTPLARIEHLEVCAWIAEVHAAGKAPATVHKVHQLLSKMLAAAVRGGLIPANPCEGVSLPKIERKEQLFLEPAEVATLANSIDEQYASLIIVLAYCGLRISEAIGLRVENVDLVRGRVTIVEQLVETKGQMTVHPPKTSAGRRSVPVPRSLCDELAQQVAGKEPREYVFTAPQGGPIRRSLWRRRFFIPAVKSAGLDVRLRIHDLRHTAVALWIAAGASPKELAVRAGHASVSTILDTYGHMLPETEAAVTDNLDEMLRREDVGNHGGQLHDLQERRAG